MAGAKEPDSIFLIVDGFLGFGEGDVVFQEVGGGFGGVPCPNGGCKAFLEQNVARIFKKAVLKAGIKAFSMVIPLF